MRLWHVVLLAIALCLFLVLTRPPRSRGGPAPVSPSTPDAVRITQFYPASPSIARGDKTLLCYGVDNAKSVRLSPPVEKVWPALVRCFEVTPAHTTTYTLTAEDAQGRVATESTKIVVGPARPKLIDVSVNRLEVKAGELVTLCFKAENATNYQAGGMQPLDVATAGGLMLNTPERGCFADHPRKTTNYTVKVTGPGGEDSEKVTVVVK